MYFIFIKENFRGDSDPVKILQLVLYSSDNDGPYDKMKKATEKYYNTFKNVKTVYYKFDPYLTKDYELKDNILSIKGEESYIPGILEKTFHVLQYFKEELKNYDYVLRSNISTIVKFDELSDELKNNRVDYGCALCFGIEKYEETDKVLPPEIFSSGTSIILSGKLALNIIENEKYADKTIIDDVSIGKLIFEKFPKIKMKQIFSDEPQNNFYFFPNLNGDVNKIKEFMKEKKIVFFRNHNGDREIDYKQVEIIIQILLGNK
jgi:hypothetical protein